MRPRRRSRFFANVCMVLRYGVRAESGVASCLFISLEPAMSRRT